MTTDSPPRAPPLGRGSSDSAGIPLARIRGRGGQCGPGPPRLRPGAWPNESKTKSAARASERSTTNKSHENTADRATTRTAREQAAQQIHVLRNHGATGERAADGGTYPYRYPYTPLQCHPRSVLVEPPVAPEARGREREGKRRAPPHSPLHSPRRPLPGARLLEPGPPSPILSPSLSPSLRPSLSPSLRPIPARARPEPSPMPARLAGAGGAQRERRPEPARGPLAVEVEEAGEGGGEHRDGDE